MGGTVAPLCDGDAVDLDGGEWFYDLETRSRDAGNEDSGDGARRVDRAPAHAEEARENPWTDGLAMLREHLVRVHGPGEK